MINGEPTENRLALASKGALHVEVVARGRMAHSAYPELGESAIDKLVEALHRLHAMKLPEDADVGTCTKNVGLIQGGRAPNVISDFAKADLFYRLVGPADALRREITEAVGELAEVRFTRETPFLRLRTLEGLPTMVVAFTTDVPTLTNWASAAAGARVDSRRAHRGRIRGEDATGRGGRDLLCDGEETGSLTVRRQGPRSRNRPNQRSLTSTLIAYSVLVYSTSV